MKKRTKGILAFLFLGGIMVTSGVVIAIPGIVPEDENTKITITGTPEDNFPDVERPRFCGSKDPKSTNYIKEYSIPTSCTSPLGITTDYDGNVWFAETNTGNLGKFDPETETFTEYDNRSWKKGVRSMIWGVDYAPDGSVWFTDEANDSVWKFSTNDEKYERLSYPTVGDSMPQKIKVDGSQIIINDFIGNKITLLDPNQLDEDSMYISLPSPTDGGVTSDFAIDNNDNIWYTNWVFQQKGDLIKFNQTGYQSDVASRNEKFLPLLDYIETFRLPAELQAANGIVIDNAENIWLADTTSSSFFKFNPQNESFTQYITAKPTLSTYGNQTGIVKDPISRPYWMESDDKGRIIFNSQTANSISVMDPVSESLVEYHIPSKNPYWSDCDPGTGVIQDCGIAQVFGFTVDKNKIWFTEWVENNIGVVDTSIPLYTQIQLESDTLNMSPGESVHFNFIASVDQQELGEFDPVLETSHDFIDVKLTHGLASIYEQKGDKVIHTDITVSDDAIPGVYKILMGVQFSDVSISKFITVTIR